MPIRIQIDTFVGLILLQVRQQPAVDTPRIFPASGTSQTERRWKNRVNVVIEMNCEPHLLEVVPANCDPGCFACRLNGGKQEGE